MHGRLSYEESRSWSLYQAERAVTERTSQQATNAGELREIDAKRVEQHPP